MISAYISHLVTLQQSCQRPSRQVRRNGACANHDVHRHVEASNAVRRGGCGYGLGGIQHCLRLEGLESSWWNCPLFFQHVSRNTIKVDQSLGFFENHMSCGWGSNYQTGPASQARWGTSGYVSRHGRISQTWERWAGHGSELANRMVLV